MGQAKQTPICKECGARGPKGTRKAHEEGWGRPGHGVWLCPSHHEEAQQRRREEEAQRRKEEPRPTMNPNLAAALALALKGGLRF